MEKELGGREDKGVRDERESAAGDLDWVPLP
jgi:hypothetical protein